MPTLTPRKAPTKSGRPPLSPSFWFKVLTAVLTANLAVIASFTLIVQRKLAQAVALAAPQEGTLTRITAASCTLCRDFSPQEKAVKAQNVDILQEKDIGAESAEGQALISRYRIGKLPAIVFEAKERIKTPLLRALEKNGHVEGENVIVWEQQAPPFFDTASSETKGVVAATYLTDTMCTECTDIRQAMPPILGRFGLTPASETVIDFLSPEGSVLAGRYGITQIPTVILSPEAQAYQQLAATWRQIGSLEEDGSFILRNHGYLRFVFRDLTSGTIVGSNPQS